MKNPFKNREKLSAAEAASEVKTKAGALALEGITAVQAEDDGRQVVNDKLQLARELAEKGYDTVTQGRGPWIDDQARVIDELAFGNPDGSKVAVTTYKFYTMSGTTMRSFPYVEKLAAGAYQEHVDKWQIEFSPEQPIDAFINPAPNPEEPQA